MKIADFESRLKAVVVGVGVIVKLQNVIVVWEAGAKRLPTRIAGVRRTDCASVKISPVEQVPTSGSDVGNTKRRLVAQLLLDGEIISMVHRSREIPYDLDHIEGRGRCRALPIYVHARSHANEISAKRVGQGSAVEGQQVVRWGSGDVNGEDALRNLGKEPGTGRSTSGNRFGEHEWRQSSAGHNSKNSRCAARSYRSRRCPRQTRLSDRSYSCLCCKAGGLPGLRTRWHRLWGHPAKS